MRERVSEPYKRANRKFHPEDTVVKAGSAKIGGGSFAVIAGPCSVDVDLPLFGPWSHDYDHKNTLLWKNKKDSHFKRGIPYG